MTEDSPRNQSPQFTIRRREALGAIGASTALATVPGSAMGNRQRVPRADGPTTSTGQTAASSSETPITLEGNVTVSPVEHDEYILIGTSAGLYVFAETGTDHLFRTRPVTSITPLGDDHVLVLVEDRYFPNVIAVDLSSGDVAWSTARDRSVYNQRLGQHTRQVPVFDATAVETSGTGPDDAVIAAAYGIWRVDGETGDVEWTRERDFYTWRVETVDGTVLATTQDGRVIGLDADSGDREFATRLVDRYESGQLSIPRSVWDLAILEAGQGDAVVTGEDGTVAIIDADDGSVVVEESLLEFDDDELDRYYRRQDGKPTLPGTTEREADPNFFNLSMTTPADASSGFLVRVVEGDPHDQDLQLVRFSPDGSIGWTEETLALDYAGSVLWDESVEAGTIHVPTDVSEDGIEITKLSAEDGSLVDELTVPTVTGARRRRRSLERIYLGAFAGDLLVSPETGDTVLIDGDGSIQWSFPSIRERGLRRADLTGSGHDDYLTYSRNSLDRRSSEEVARHLAVWSGETGDNEWSWTRELPELFETGGLREIGLLEAGNHHDLVVLDDVPPVEDHDELRDIENQFRDVDRQLQPLRDELESLQEHPDDREDQIADLQEQIEPLEDQRADLIEDYEALVGEENPRILVISGQDGTQQQDIELFIQADDGLPEQLDVHSVAVIDETGDGSVLVGDSDGVFAVDLADGAIFWERNYDLADEWPPIDGHEIRYRAVGGSDGGVADLLAYSPHDAEFALLETTRAGDDIGIVDQHLIDIEGERVPGAIESVGDLNGDGYEELLVPVDTEDERTIALVAPGEQRVVFQHGAEHGTPPSVRAMRTRDGEATGLVVTVLLEDSYTVRVYDGLEERWQSTQPIEGRYRGILQDYTIHAAAPAGDIDGDGQEEIAVGKAGDEGAMVEFYNTATDERVDRLVLEPFAEDVDVDDDDFAPALTVDQIPDAGDTETPLVGLTVMSSDGGDATSFYIVDPVEGTVRVSGDGNVARFLPLEDGVGLVGADGRFRRVDLTLGVTLEEPSPGSTVDLSWEFADDGEYVTTVLVNDEPIQITDDTEASVRLPDGEHDVEVAARRADGLRIHDRTTVDIDEGSMMALLLYLGAGASVIALFGMTIVETIKRRVQS